MSVIDISLSAGDSVLRETRIQITVEWKIKKSFRMMNTPNCRFDSRSFSLFNAEWFLRMYPNGREDNGTEGWISLFLGKKSSPTELRTLYTLGIQNADGSVVITWDGNDVFRKEETVLGMQKLILLRSKLLESKDIMKPDDVLTVFCTVRIEDGAVGVEAASQTSLPYSIETLSQNFDELFLSKNQTDITIKVKDKEFVAHKLVLAARSSVFRSMFEVDMTEKSSGVIDIVDCASESFEDFLLFLYSGKLDIVSSRNALSLYFTSDKYNVKELKEACCECMAREICVDSICDVVKIAALHNEDELLNTARDFFAHNANSIIKTSKWQSFLTEHTALGNDLFIKMTDKSNVETKDFLNNDHTNI